MPAIGSGASRWSPAAAVTEEAAPRGQLPPPPGRGRRRPAGPAVPNPSRPSPPRPPGRHGGAGRGPSSGAGGGGGRGRSEAALAGAGVGAGAVAVAWRRAAAPAPVGASAPAPELALSAAGQVRAGSAAGEGVPRARQVGRFAGGERSGLLPPYDPALSAVLPSPAASAGGRCRRSARRGGCGPGAAAPRPAARAGEGPLRCRLPRAPGSPGAAEGQRRSWPGWLSWLARLGTRPAASCLRTQPARPPPRGHGGVSFVSGMVPAGRRPGLGAFGGDSVRAAQRLPTMRARGEPGTGSCAPRRH